MKPPPDVEFTAAMAVADRAMQQVLGDRAVWSEEQRRTGAASLSWPPRIEAEGREGLLKVLAITAVEQVLLAMVEADSGERQPDDDPRFRAYFHRIVQALDPADADVQVMLRVVRRALVAADTALIRDFGGQRGRRILTGKRAFANWVKCREVEAAIRSGIPRAEALRLLPISRAAAYRAMKRR